MRNLDVSHFDNKLISRNLLISEVSKIQMQPTLSPRVVSCVPTFPRTSRSFPLSPLQPNLQIISWSAFKLPGGTGWSSKQSVSQLLSVYDTKMSRCSIIVLNDIAVIVVVFVIVIACENLCDCPSISDLLDKALKLDYSHFWYFLWFRFQPK